MKRLLIALGTALALAVPGFAAAQATTTLTVSASVAAACTVAALPTLNFGPYDPLAGGALAGNGTISVTCTKNTASARIDLDNGQYFATKRRMRHATDPAEHLSYDLLKPVAAGAAATCSGNAWGTGATDGYSPAASDFTSGTVAVDFKVCGSVDAGQNVATGAYSDTVGVTVNF